MKNDDNIDTNNQTHPRPDNPNNSPGKKINACDHIYPHLYKLDVYDFTLPCDIDESDVHNLNLDPISLISSISSIL